MYYYQRIYLMAITGINSQYNQLQAQLMSQMFQKLGASSGYSFDIGNELNGSSNTNPNVNSSVALTEMQSLMQSMMDTMMIGSMFTALGMENPFASSSSSSSTSSVTTPSAGDTTTASGITIPGINDIIEGSTINIDGTEAKVTPIIRDPKTNDLSVVQIGDKLYKKMDNIGINNQDTFQNVFVQVQAIDIRISTTETDATYNAGTRYEPINPDVLYYYYNGTMTQINNVSAMKNGGATTLASRLQNGTDSLKMALGSVVYTVTAGAEGEDLTLTDDNGNTKEATLIQSTIDKLVYKIGNATYEVINGVFVPRNTKVEVGGTIELTTYDQDGSYTTDATQTVSSYKAGKEIKIGNQTFTRYQDTDKTFQSTLNLYTPDNSKTLFILEGTELKEINKNDIKYHRENPGIDITDKGFGNKELQLNTTMDNQEIKYYETTEHGKTRLIAYNTVDGTTTDATDNLDYYAQAIISGSDTILKITKVGDDYEIQTSTDANQQKAKLTRQDIDSNMKENVWICTRSDSNNTFLNNGYYIFESGQFKLASGVELYKTIQNNNNTSFNLNAQQGNTLIVEGDKISLISSDTNGKATIETYTKQTGGAWLDNIYLGSNDTYYKFENGKFNKLDNRWEGKNLQINGTKITSEIANKTTATFEFRGKRVIHYSSGGSAVIPTTHTCICSFSDSSTTSFFLENYGYTITDQDEIITHANAKIVAESHVQSTSTQCHSKSDSGYFLKYIVRYDQ